MAYYCGECGTQLKSQKIKKVTGTTKIISHKVLIVQTTRRYICPNGCVMNRIKQT